MAIYHLVQTPIGKTTHDAGTASAHVRYIFRESAAVTAVGGRMPTNKWAAERWMDTHEQTSRKNARVCDKVLVALPKELNPEQQMSLVRRFGERVTKGRASWLAVFHTGEEDQVNPHCHIIFVDRDPETGKRVIGLSEKGSTDMLRQTWEVVTNEALEAGGIDARIDRRPRKEQEKDMEPTIEQDRPEDADTPSEAADLTYRVERLFSARDEFREYTRQVDQLEDLKTRAAHLETNTVPAQRWKLEEAAANVAGRAADFREAQAALETVTRADGSLKGFTVRLGKWEWHSGARQDALLRQREAEARKQALSLAEKTKAERTEALGKAERDRDSAWERLQEKQTSLRLTVEERDTRQTTLGTDDELEGARTILQSSLRAAARSISFAELKDAREKGDLSDDVVVEISRLKDAIEEQKDKAVINISEAREAREERQSAQEKGDDDMSP